MGKVLRRSKKTNGNTEELYQLFGSVEAVNTVLTMTSDQGMNLFQQSMDQMTTNTTALDDAFTKVDETAGNKMRKNFNELKNASIELGDALAPVMEEVTSVIGGLTSTLEGMDKGTVTTIADVVMFSTALGGVLKVVGGVADGVGTVINVASKLSGALGTATVATETVAEAGAVAGGVGGATGFGALATGMGGAVVAAAPYIAVAGAVALAGYGIYKGLTQEVVPSVDLFADKVEYTSQTVQTEYGAMTQNVATNTIKISEATKTAVKDYLDMDQNAKASLQDLYINGNVITGQIATGTKAKFDGMTQSVIQGYEKQKTDSISKITRIITQQNTITSTEQTEIMQKATEFILIKRLKHSNMKIQINQIIQNAANNHRTLTSQEVTDIGQLQNQMKENAVKSLSDNEVEAQVILQRMKDYDGRITAEQASEHIQKLNESRDGAIKAANDEYDQTVATIIKQRDE
ncbi:hypothetical protein BCM20_004337 [Clostridium beijerinckii]|nr:phage tail tape measure protein [Clostridium beijerinckii]NYC04382.1 hypothetical protein [Clostridium beijerinckii]